MISHPMKHILPLLIALLLGSAANAAEAPVALKVWPVGKMPGVGAVAAEMEAPTKGDGVVRLTNVSEPDLTVFRAPSATASTPAVIICPGGGYQILAINKEGTEIAAWLNTLGITGVVLKYRVPNNRDGALQDIQRAVRLVRARQKEWNIDATRVGVMGFSAGGNLCARLSTTCGTASYPAIDDTDQLDDRPDFVVLESFEGSPRERAGPFDTRLAWAAPTSNGSAPHRSSASTFVRRHGHVVLFSCHVAVPGHWPIVGCDRHYLCRKHMGSCSSVRVFMGYGTHAGVVC